MRRPRDGRSTPHKAMRRTVLLAALALLLYGLGHGPVKRLAGRDARLRTPYNMVYLPLRYVLASREPRRATTGQLAPYRELCFLGIDGFPRKYVEFAPVLSPKRGPMVTISSPWLATSPWHDTLQIHADARPAGIARLKPGDFFTPVLRSRFWQMTGSVVDYVSLELVDVVPTGDRVPPAAFEDAYPVLAMTSYHTHIRTPEERFEYLARHYRNGRYGLMADIMGVVSGNWHPGGPTAPTAFLTGWSRERLIQSLGQPRVVRVSDRDCWANIPKWLAELKLQPNGTEYVLWYGERGPPDHWPGDETFNLYFLLRDDRVLDYRELAP